MGQHPNEATGQHKVAILDSIEDIDAATWNACATSDGRFNPFLSHEFLTALEVSGSAVGRTGWQPFHCRLTSDDELVGVAPMYIKSHSQGEYVFDHSWADAWHRAGGNYYPKLQASIPFTPATGRRVLPAKNDAQSEQAMLAAMVQICEQVEVSSLHLTFMTEPQWQCAGQLGLLRRMDQQFHWHNPGYDNFDAFLADLSSKKRKNLRRERRDALASGVRDRVGDRQRLERVTLGCVLPLLHGHRIPEVGAPLPDPASFFSRIGETLAEHTLLIMCKRGGPLYRRRAQLHRQRHPVRFATGAHWSTTLFCISKCATTRRSTLPSRAG